MTQGITWCFEDQSLDDIAQMMEQKQIHHLPVLNSQKRMVGIVALDLALRGTLRPMKWRGSHRVTLSGMPRSFIDRGLDPIGEATDGRLRASAAGQMLAAGADGRIGEGGAGMIQRQGCCEASCRWVQRCPTERASRTVGGRIVGLTKADRLSVAVS